MGTEVDCSWITAKNQCHAFVVEDNTMHPGIEEINDLAKKVHNCVGVFLCRRRNTISSFIIVLLY